MADTALLSRHQKRPKLHIPFACQPASCEALNGGSTLLLDCPNLTGRHIWPCIVYGQHSIQGSFHAADYRNSKHFAMLLESLDTAGGGHSIQHGEVTQHSRGRSVAPTTVTEADSRGGLQQCIWMGGQARDTSLHCFNRCFIKHNT